jgi:hypothetical protein
MIRFRRTSALMPIPSLAAALVLATLASAPAIAFAHSYHQHDSGGPASGPEHLTWRLESAGHSRLQLSLEIERGDGGRNQVSEPIPAETVQGFDRAFLDGGRHTAELTLRRDAGTFHLSGEFDDGWGSGRFTFEPDSRFASELERRGIGRPTFDQQLDLATDDCGFELLDALREAGYRGFDVETLVRVGHHGLDRDYVSGMAASGYRLGDVNQLVRARDHGVGPQYAHAMHEAGFGAVEIEMLVRARDHGVDGDYAADLAAAGYPRAPLEELIRAHDHGVSGSFARRARARYGDDLSLDDVIRMQDRGGIRD